MKPARQIHRSDSVASWLDDVDACDPYIRSRVEYAVDAIQDDRITVGLCQSLLQAYTQLRDWVCKPCPELEKWLASEIVPLFPTLSNALDHISLPDTILDDETVKVWLVKANIVDPALHRDLTVLIRTRSLKYGRHLPVPDKTRAAVDRWFEENAKACDPMLVDGAGSPPTTEPPESTTSATDADVVMGETERPTKQSKKHEGKRKAKVAQPEQSDEATSDGGLRPQKRNRIGGPRQRSDTVVQKRDATAEKKDSATQKKDKLAQKKDKLAQKKDKLAQKDKPAQKKDEPAQKKEKPSQKKEKPSQKKDNSARKRDGPAQKKDISEEEAQRSVSSLPRSTTGRYNRRELIGLAASEKKKPGTDGQDSTGIELGPAFEPSNHHSTASSNSPGPSMSPGTPTPKAQSTVGVRRLQDPSQNQPTDEELQEHQGNPQTSDFSELNAVAREQVMLSWELPRRIWEEAA